jgi:4-amino-4-deoxy-L-arabinose transferase-like glycosyltransferase
MRSSNEGPGLGPNRRALLIALVALAFAARLAGDLYLGFNEAPIADDLHYDQLAESLAEGDGYTIRGTFISFRPPLYPVFLSLVYRVAGHDFVAARVAQAVLGVLATWLTFVIGRRLFGERRAFAAAALFAVAPADVFFFHGLLTETLFIPLVAVMVYGFLRLGGARAARPVDGSGWASNRWPVMGWSIFTGAVLGAATLTRPVLLLFPPFLLLWAVWSFRKPPAVGGGIEVRGVCWALSGIILSALIVMSPWLYLVHERTGRWVPVTTGGGVTFWGANNIRVLERDHWGRWVFIGELPFYDELKVVAADQVEVDRRAWRLGLNFLANNPGKVPKLLVYKFARFWNPWANLPIARKIAYFLTYGLALPWMFAGMVMTFRRDGPEVILHLIVGTLSLSALVFWGDARIRSGVSPYLWMFAVVAGQRAWARIRGRGGSERVEAETSMGEKGTRS